MNMNVSTNEKEPQLAEVSEMLCRLLGDVPDEERAELRSTLQERLLDLLRIEGLPAELAGQLGMPLSRATSLDAWCRERIAAGSFADDDFAALRTAAALVDYAATTERPLLAFLPVGWQVDDAGRLCIPGPRFDLGRFNPSVKQLTEYQRKHAKRYLHPNLLRSVAGADLTSAGVYSFALFLLDVFLGIQGATRGEVQDALDKCVHRSGQPVPPDVPVLFRQVVTAGHSKPLGWTCRELLSAVLRSLRESPFVCDSVVTLAVRHRRFAYSVQGLHKEGGNEDRHYTCHEGPASLLLVADGVSTADLGSGEMAAEEIVRLMQFDHQGQFRAAAATCLRDPQAWSAEADSFLAGLFGAANQKVVQQVNTLYPGRKDRIPNPQSPMCSTLTAAFVLGDQAVIHYLGDSPAWLFSPSRNLFCKLTTDHHAGREKGFSLELDKQATALTRVIGACEFSLDHQGFVALDQEAGRVRVQLRTGDLLLLASDGLVEAIDAFSTVEKVGRFESEVRRQAQDEPDLKKLVRKLIALAEDGLSNDNITLNALRLESEEPKRG